MHRTSSCRDEASVLTDRSRTSSSDIGRRLPVVTVVAVERSERLRGSRTMHAHHHSHVPPRTVLTAIVITLTAAVVEFAGSWRSGSYFLAADATHLVAHLGIFGVLLIPTRRHSEREIEARAHARMDDRTTIAVLALVLCIALGIAAVSVRDLLSGSERETNPAFMLLALLGLGANTATSFLFIDPARTHWSFRAALAHELSDGAMTIVGLVGALAIKLFGWRWVDPSLSLMIGAWLAGWSSRLLLRRLQIGARAWAIEDEDDTVESTIRANDEFGA